MTLEERIEEIIAANCSYEKGVLGWIELRESIRQQLEKAVAEEREACARLVEGPHDIGRYRNLTVSYSQEIAAKIRARGSNVKPG